MDKLCEQLAKLYEKGTKKFIVQKGAGDNCLPVIWGHQPVMSYLKKAPL